MKKNEIDYKKKQKIYELLAAKQFKKIVLKLEKSKWHFIKKLFPDYLKLYEKKCKKEYQRRIKKTTTEKEQQELKSFYRRKILLARKEFNNDKNRNYHIDLKRPTEILNSLQWNKKVHKQGLIKNLATAIFCVGCVTGNFYSELAKTILLLQIPSAIINWQCINLQNYNICRIKSHGKTLETLEKRQVQREEAECLSAAKVIEKACNDNKEEIIPSAQEIIDRIDNQEQLQQLKRMVEQQLIAYRCSDKEKNISEVTKK